MVVGLRSEGGCRRRIEKAMQEAKDTRWEKANSRLAKKIDDDSKKREVEVEVEGQEVEVEGQAKRQRQGGPQQEVSTPKQVVDAAVQEPENRKRKAEE